MCVLCFLCVNFYKFYLWKNFIFVRKWPIWEWQYSACFFKFDKRSPFKSLFIVNHSICCRNLICVAKSEELRILKTENEKISSQLVCTLDVTKTLQLIWTSKIRIKHFHFLMHTNFVIACYLEMFYFAKADVCFVLPVR